MKNAKFPRFWNSCREVESMGKMNAEIEEDEEALYLMSMDYPHFFD